MMKFSRAISRLKWLSGEKTSISKTMPLLLKPKQFQAAALFEIPVLTFPSQEWCHINIFPAEEICNKQQNTPNILKVSEGKKM
jgi:hypothetical protein